MMNIMTTIMQTPKNIKVGFWGGPEISLITLEKLETAGFKIAFIVTSLDKPQGRKMIITPPATKVWGLAHNIPVIQPTNIKSESFAATLKEYDCDIFVVMAYGKIMPLEILNMPKAGSLNIHPSLLPKFRGPCPIESAILADEKETGVSIMQMDNEMDHGPIIAQEKVIVKPWPPTAEILGFELVTKGSDMLVSILPDYVAGKIAGIPQDHSHATYTKKIQKEDGLIDLAGDPYQNYLKIQAYHGWPSAFFFKDGKRIKITQASFKDGKLVIEKVIPEGKSEMKYTDLR
jgi:methionyl-tRNA formyltransferase